MKLREIYNTGSQSVSNIPLDQFDLNQLQIVAPAETPFSIVKTVSHGNHNLILFGISNVQNDSKHLLSYVTGEFHTIFGQQYFIIGGAWTEPEWRRKGLMTALYVGLVKQLNIKLMSDRSQSPEMFDVWKRLVDKDVAKIIDTKTGSTVSISPDKIYQHTDNKEDNYRFIIEYQQEVIPNIGLGILYEYQNYTHIDKTGDYD